MYNNCENLSGSRKDFSRLRRAHNSFELYAPPQGGIFAKMSRLPGAPGDQLAYSIAGRSISKMSPEELIKWRDAHADRYQRAQVQPYNGVNRC